MTTKAVKELWDRVAEAKKHTPGGQLDENETARIAASVARAHGMTMEALLNASILARKEGQQ